MSPFERWGVRLSAVLVTVTGLLYAGMEYLLTPARPWDAVNHPLQPLVLKLHILTAPLLVFALGMITVRHVWTHLREGLRTGRRSGLSLAVTAIAMVSTGYLIQAVTRERWLVWLGLGHLAAGTVFGAVLLVHQLIARSGASPASSADRAHRG